MKAIENMDWTSHTKELDEKGFILIKGVLSRAECDHIQSFYGDENLFRSVICMQRYRFGKGEYKYLNYPLPPMIQSLRELFYTPLAGIANEWMKKLNVQNSFPAGHHDFLSRCHQHSQAKPTPLILKYESGGFNTLHQDLYGDIYFPFQVVLVLTQKGRDHDGGELIFTEQLPRAQSRAEVVMPDQGDAVVFTTNFRPVKGSRGYYRAKMKHGVSPLKSGKRFALGIIFHDAA